ncbi:PD-(D/E)XK nuclease family protein [Fluviispira multicolorata]|uniref:PD-(D/E)XK endonuclease-like domain-containing protein n=1 Tax=Fluviispira multicolorata TaxID=2654512 RepID=A0A833JHN0_9BACT|nr:PD-(D/E)XK nuclease family protein [Fluviispira multicolorata]KAB8033482.1 hypothetical protein GCL57_01910 [Fluviispira multicolorata]
MKKDFFENSMFLCNHKGIKEFAENFINQQIKEDNIQWSVICERKEDLIAIRNQLFYEIDKQNHTQNNTNAIMGISMYTLDSLAQNFCSTLAATTNKKLLAELPSFIHKPYLDVINQENLIEIILQLFGYAGNDSLPLAKQILSLIDATWPPDLNFVQLILSTQEKESTRSVQEINEIALKQIIAAYQYASLELKNYSRLQNLVSEYLQGSFKDHLFNTELNKELVLPKKFLKGNILWISAPEYPIKNIEHIEKIKDNECIKPGNFQCIVVSEFKKAILKARDILNFTTNSFYDSRTILTQKYKNSSQNLESEEHNQNSHISYYVAENKHNYFDLLNNVLNEKETLTLLADFDPGTFKETRSDAGGSYNLSLSDFEEWQNKNFSYTDSKNIFPKIDDLFQNFLDKISLISDEELLSKIAINYSINFNTINSDVIFKLFQRNLEKETITLGEPHPIAKSPRALSFLNGKFLPQKIVAAGRAHAPTSSSFHVKVLNNAISLLRKQGVLIDLPASEIMYRGYWKNLCEQQIPIEFWLENSRELDNFPTYLKPKRNIFELGQKLPDTHFSNLFLRLNSQSEDPKFYITDWKSRFLYEKKYLSITEFERYILCPLQYFLTDILGIKKLKNENLNIDYMSIGTKMHMIAEQIITRLVTLLGNEDYSKVMSSVYESILHELKNETLFLSSDKETWYSLFKTALDNSQCQNSSEIFSAFKEAIDILWSIEKSVKSTFEKNIERETIKRTFYRFLMLEKEFTQNIPNKKTGLERERNIVLELSDLKFIGKIDRIDATSEGLHIIDYKTSKATKQNSGIVILPSELKNKKTAKLCVQGGLYSLAWASQKLLTEEKNYFHKIISFSLFQLKNLDEEKNIILNYIFKSPLEKDSDLYLKIYNEFSEYAKNLKEGDFYPKPVQAAQCDFCDFKSICPLPNEIKPEAEESEGHG